MLADLKLAELNLAEVNWSTNGFQFTFAICYRPSVCRLSVTFVRPTQAVEMFGNISTALGTWAIH